jgi:transketolase
LALGLAISAARDAAVPTTAQMTTFKDAFVDTPAPALSDARSPRVYVLLGDGELQEGQIWEAAMFAAHRRLSNLVAIIDNNGLQIDGALEEVVGLGNIEEKFRAFGWRVISVDGHDIGALKGAFDAAATELAGPVAIVARTVKGKGVSFMEGRCEWHGKAPDAGQCAQALAGLEACRG